MPMNSSIIIAASVGREQRTFSLTTPSLEQMASHLKTCAKAQLAIAGSFQLPQPFPKCQAEWRKSSSMRTMRLARTASMLYSFTPSAFLTQSLLTTIFHFENRMENLPRIMPHPHQTKPSLVLSSRKPLPSTTATTNISLVVTQFKPSKPSTVPLPHHISTMQLTLTHFGTRSKLLTKEETSFSVVRMAATTLIKTQLASP